MIPATHQVCAECEGHGERNPKGPYVFCWHCDGAGISMLPHLRTQQKIGGCLKLPELTAEARDLLEQAVAAMGERKGTE